MIQQISDWWHGKPHVARSSKWPGLRQAFLQYHPTCAVCGTSKKLEVHHCEPVHVNSTRELDTTNLITLCDVHHFWWGHLGNWHSWNVLVRVDSAIWLAKILSRPKK